MLKRVLVAFAALAAVCPLFAATVGVQVGPGRVYTPSSITIAPGDTVTWTFAETFHSTTSDATTGPEVWDSGVVFTMGTTFSHTFNTVGTYPYYCSIHSFPGGTAMNGVVNVVAPAPAITSVVPSSGPATGGTAATINGTSFDASCTATFGGVGATTGTITATTIAVTTPPHAAGPVSVGVTCTGGSATLANAFTYLGPAPAITSVQPSSAAPGASVTIAGSNFVQGATVRFAQTLSSVTFVDANTLVAVVPNLPAGPALITVTNPDGQSAIYEGFTVLAPAAPVPLLSTSILLLLGCALALAAGLKLR